MSLRATEEIQRVLREHDRQYRDIVRGIDLSAVLEADRLFRDQRKMLESLGGFTGLIEQARQAKEFADASRAFGIDRMLQDAMVAQSTTVAGMSAGLMGKSVALTQAIDVSGLSKTIADLQKAATGVAAYHTTDFATIKASWLRGVGSYTEAVRQAQSLFDTYSENQAGIAASLEAMKRESLVDLAISAEALDIGDWSDVETIEDVDDEEIRHRLFLAIEIFLQKLGKAVNPAHWTPSDVLAFLFFVYALCTPAFTEVDRQALKETSTAGKAARDNSIAALNLLKSINDSEVAHRQYVDYVSNLPRAVTERRAYVRLEPVRSARTIVALADDTPLAILESNGRWRKVIYRDPLTDQLSVGWMWGGSVKMLNDD